MEEIKPEKEKNYTVFGTETEFEGVLHFTDNLVISGTFNGTIDSTGNLELAKSAVCTVDTAKADSVVIAGRFTGSIEAKNSIEMCSGSKITGNIKTSKLRIEDEVNFDGAVTMFDVIDTPDVFSMSGEELKKKILAV